jgi:hypothetical protein
MVYSFKKKNSLVISAKYWNELRLMKLILQKLLRMLLEIKLARMSFHLLNWSWLKRILKLLIFYVIVSSHLEKNVNLK